MNPDPFSLDRLVDIVEGPEVGLWPLAPAWYCILAVLALQLMYWATKFVVTFRANAYRRQALAELESLQQGQAVELSRLLKRVALVAFPRQQVASLTGEQWVKFLEQSVNGVAFQVGSKNPLANASVLGDPLHLSDEEWNALSHSARQWIRRHRIAAGHRTGEQS